MSKSDIVRVPVLVEIDMTSEPNPDTKVSLPPLK